MEVFQQLWQKVSQELPRLWERSPSKDEKYISHSWHLPPVDLAPLIPRMPMKVIGYWSSPDRNKNILALLPLKFFGSASSFKQMKQLFQTNRQITFFGGQHFFPTSTPPSHEWAGFGSYHYFLPALCFERNPEQTTLTLTWSREISRNNAKQADYIFQVKRALKLHKTTARPITKKTSYDICSSNQWNEIANMALKYIQTEQLEKVVLARKKIVELTGSIPPQSIFENIRHHNSNDNYQYYLQSSPNTAFISMTPEKLFELKKNKISTHALAGTRPRGRNPEEDTRWEEELQNSPKELHEHQLVVSFLKKQLEQISTGTTCHPTQVLKLPHVQHLQTNLEGTISSSSDVGEIISHLHPAPSIGGQPTDEALKFINDNELFERGLYAAPIGVIQNNYAHFAIAIRSALLHHNKLHLYAGAGIVKGSQGNEEWKETQNKMQTFQEIF